MVLFLKPMNPPTKTKGNETPNHMKERMTRVLKGMAADDCSYSRQILIKMNIEKQTEGKNSAVTTKDLLISKYVP